MFYYRIALLEIRRVGEEERGVRELPVCFRDWKRKRLKGLVKQDKPELKQFRQRAFSPEYMKAAVLLQYPFRAEPLLPSANPHPPHTKFHRPILALPLLSLGQLHL